MSKPKVIAFYLPQYHPTPDNDKWWGKGFTEWTNVGKAKPLFKGHYQPKVPADLGYYDLRLPEVREAQVELAKEAGIYGFCYYHYWFAGKEELELPFNEILRLGRPDFPFMLCWANESWHKKFWNKDGIGSSKEMLIEQTYPGDEDHIAHFNRLLPAFKDPRYIRIDGKPAFMIYKPLDFPKVKEFIELWNSLAKKEDLLGLFFIAHTQDENNNETYNQFISLGFNAVNTVGLYFSRNTIDIKIKKNLRKLPTKIYKKLFSIPYSFEFSEFNKYIFNDLDSKENIFPTLIPNWDHTPRSGRKGFALVNSTPELFKEQIDLLFKFIENKKDPIIFLKSWNEWGEGNYIEPDLKFGKGYIKELRRFVDNFSEQE